MITYNEAIINKGYKDINPMQFGSEICSPSHSFGPALRTYWLLHYVVSGKGHFRIKDREYTVTAGNIFVIPPFVETYYEADSRDPWEYIWVGFTADSELDFLFSDVMYMPQTHHIFEGMKKCSNMNKGKTEFLCSKIWQLISMIYDHQNILKEINPNLSEEIYDMIHVIIRLLCHFIPLINLKRMGE